MTKRKINGKFSGRLETSALDFMPDSPPVFEGIVKLKKEKKIKKETKVKEEPEAKPEVDDRSTETPVKKPIKTVQLKSPTSTDSPHKIYLRKSKKDKKNDKKAEKVNQISIEIFV